MVAMEDFLAPNSFKVIQNILLCRAAKSINTQQQLGSHTGIRSKAGPIRHSVYRSRASNAIPQESEGTERKLGNVFM